MSSAAAKGLPKIDQETERRDQAAFWELPEDAAWPQIRERVYERNNPMVPPRDWEMTMRSLFGSDLFEARPILRVY